MYDDLTDPYSNKRKNNDDDDMDGAGGITTAGVVSGDVAAPRQNGVVCDGVGPVIWPELDESIPAAWEASGYTSAAAVAEWTSIGIDSPMVAAQWINAGFTPEQASMWVEIGDMSPSEAMEAVNNGVAPIDIERVRRADPGWTRPEDPSVADPDRGVWM